MEEIAEGLGKGVFRFIKWIIIDAFIEFFVYGYGYLTLKLITLGKYPKSGQDNDTLCIIAGLISIAVTIGLIMVFNAP